jgi:hypothetical protein
MTASGIPQAVRRSNVSLHAFATKATYLVEKLEALEAPAAG